MLNGAHIVIYSKDAAADRAFFRDVLGMAHVDAGDGWLIFKLPPAEAAFHPAESSNAHELFLMCSDIAALRETLKSKGVATDDVTEAPWGLVSAMTLPGGARVKFYEPRHETAR